jgi:hypothetical protein
MFAGNTSTPPFQYPFGKLIAYNIRWLTQIRNLFRITAEIALYFGSDNRSGFTIDHGRRIQARIVWTSNLRNFSTNPKKLSSFYPKPATPFEINVAEATNMNRINFHQLRPNLHRVF